MSRSGITRVESLVRESLARVLYRAGCAGKMDLSSLQGSGGSAHVPLCPSISAGLILDTFAGEKWTVSPVERWEFQCIPFGL